MRICSMTATFGKLEGETLEFTPGLNLISAPNEWGKSTWCAFLLAMLYGPPAGKAGPASGQGALQALVRETHVRVHGNSVAGPPDHH